MVAPEAAPAPIRVQTSPNVSTLDGPDSAVPPPMDRPLDQLVTPHDEVRLIDLGCGAGRSLVSAARRFGVPGVGIDLDPRKVRKARKAGTDAMVGDITLLDPDEFAGVHYVNLDNVLEHLPSLDVVEQVLAGAVTLADRLVCIRHPSFEDEDYLASLGVKQYWTDWPGEHTAKVRVHEFVAMANRLGVYQMLVQPVGLAPDTDDPTILPLDAPSGQRRIGERAGAVSVYDPDRHGPKPDVTFARPVYFAFDIVLVVGAGSVELRYRDDPEATSQRPFVTWRAPGAGPAITAP